LEYCMGSESHRMTVALNAGDEVMGFALMRLDGQEAQLELLAVHQMVRRCGIGSVLLGDMLSIAQRYQLPQFQANVKASNLKAIQFYQSHNFSACQIIPRYYGGKHHALRMVKNLSEGECNTEQRTTNTEHRTPNTEHRTPNTEQHTIQQ